MGSHRILACIFDTFTTKSSPKFIDHIRHDHKMKSVAAKTAGGLPGLNIKGLPADLDPDETVWYTEGSEPPFQVFSLKQLSDPRTKAFVPETIPVVKAPTAAPIMNKFRKVPMEETGFHVDHGDDKFLIFEELEIENDSDKDISFNLAKRDTGRISLTLKLVTEN
jgi:hypothetical protein